MSVRTPRPWLVARYALLCAIAFAIALPFVWMVAGSFKPRAEFDQPHVVPQDPSGKAYPMLFNLAPDSQGRLLDLRFGRWYASSLLIASAVCVLQVLTSSMAAYAFSRMRWRGRDKVFLLYLGTMMIPGLVTMIPNYQIMLSLGFVDTYHGLIIPAAFSAFGTFLLRQFMLSIPASLDEAAKIDGAGHWRIYWKVIMPLARPGLIALAIITFLGEFRAFFWPLVLAQSPDVKPMSVGLLTLNEQYGPQTEVILAASVLNIVPLIIVFVIFQKLMVKGLQLGGVKG